ncbi:MAG: M48 family metallopeptidase, partial [Oscillospiraceae bacterium]|nr:M48 family metallopeptidase [Oscillospiraceae bacterium]
MKIQYEIIRSKRKTISIQVDENCNVTVRAPRFVSQKRIDEFLEEKKFWLQEAIIKQQEKAKNRVDYSAEDIEKMRKLAKEIVPQKVEHFSKIMGVTPVSVKINSAKKRYGSCSAKNNLNFSLYLMDKDEKFIDYVVIHELAHIKHHNHSKEFYGFIEQFMP